MKKQLIWIVVLVIAATMLAVAQTGSDKSTSGTQTQAITNGPVAEYVADSSVTIGWSVHDGSSNMSLKYGTDRDHMNQTAQASAGSDGRNYHVRLQGLNPETRYYFQVVQSGEPVGGVGTFRTVASGSSPLRSKATIPQ